MLCTMLVPTEYRFAIPDGGCFIFYYQEKLVALEIEQRPSAKIISYKSTDISWMSQGNQHKITAVINGEEEEIARIYSNSESQINGYCQPSTYTVFRVSFEIKDISYLNPGERLESIKLWVGECINKFIDEYLYISHDNNLERIRMSKVPLISIYISKNYILTEDKIYSDPKPHTAVLNWEPIQGSGHLRPMLTMDSLGTLQSRLIESEIPPHIQFLFEAKRQAFGYSQFDLSIVSSQTAVEVFISSQLRRYCKSREIDRLEVIIRKQKKAISIDDFLLQGISKIISKISDISNCKIRETPEYINWNEKVYQLRNSIVHAGKRGFSSDQARLAFTYSCEFIEAIEKLIPCGYDFKK
ncbi:TPA: hypothetical protein ACIJ20_000417 [Pseudomonas aeruginosa]